MKYFFSFLLLTSLYVFPQTIPYQYGWPRQASDDFGLYNNSPTVADLDGDGSLDISVMEPIVASGNQPKLTVWKMNGAYLPGFPQNIPFGSLQSSGSNEISAAGDVTGDGKPELVFGDENGQIYIFQYNGTHAPGSPFPVGATKETTTPALVDLDGDSICEIIITSFERNSPYGNAQLHVLKFNGTGFSYLPGFPYDFGYGSDGSPVVGDLDGDGLYEIIFTSNGLLSDSTISKIHVLRKDGTVFPGFPFEVSYSTLGSTPALYDLNRDGRLEIVIRIKPDRTNINGIYAIDYQGNIMPGFPFPIDYGHPYANVAIADMNGDSIPEIAYGNVVPVDSGKVYVWDLQGNILPGFPQKIWSTWVDGSVAIGDVSGDGLGDVIVPTSKGFIYAFKYDGSIVPGFPVQAENVHVVIGFETSPTLVDIDNDGDIEIFAGSLNKRVYGYDTPGIAGGDIWSTYKGNAQRTGGMLKGFIPVPVELVAFTSSVTGNNVTLNWSTATETNNKGYYIEISSGKNEWENAGFVDGSGTTTQNSHYTFSIELPVGEYNFRLKQTDYDGTFKYYVLPETVITGVPAKLALAQNYPNPFNPETTIHYSLPDRNLVTLKVFDILGNEIAVLVNADMPAGEHKIKFNTIEYKLSSGVYIYHLTAGETRIVKKMNLLK